MAMVTATVNMGSDKHNGNFHKIVIISYVLSLSSGMVFIQDALAFDWRVRPNLTMSEIFTDNIAFSDTAKKSGFITEVSPGLSLYGVSPWSNFNLNYRLQGLYNAGGGEAIDFNNQLQMNGLYQVVQNRFFVETSSSISQQNTSNTYIATDNLTGSGDRAENRNFSISPYWTPRFGQYATGLFRVGYQKSSFDNANTEGNSDNTLAISDSDNLTKQASLSSGSKFNQVRWNLNYSSQNQSRATGQNQSGTADNNDVTFEQYQGDLRYYVNRKFNVFAQTGYENNDYQTENDSIQNGFFYTVGGQWSPSKWYSLEAGYGNNKHIAVTFNPSANFFGHVTYRNKDVGLNTGNSWDANIHYRGQQAVVDFNYSQETTTVQQILQKQAIFNLSDQFGNPILDPVTKQQQQFIINIPNLVDDVIISKQANLSLGYQTGKSSYNLSVYNTRRTYELSPQEENVYGVSGGWRWQMAPRLNLYLNPTWQTIDNPSEDSSNSNDRYDVALGLIRSIPINLGRPLLMNTGLELRHISQTSNGANVDNNFSSDYTENRATANFAVQF